MKTDHVGCRVYADCFIELSQVDIFGGLQQICKPGIIMYLKYSLNLPMQDSPAKSMRIIKGGLARCMYVKKMADCVVM